MSKATERAKELIKTITNTEYGEGAVGLALESRKVIRDLLAELKKALANYKGEIKCQICNDDDLHCNYCTKGEGK